MPREQERNIPYEGKKGIGNVKCKYRYNETRYLETKNEKGKVSVSNKRTLNNRCTIMKKECTHPLCNEKTCHLPKRR